LLRFAPARRLLSPIGVAGMGGLFVFGVLYLYLCVTYAIHQREYQYTLGGTRSTPETAAAAGFTEVKIATADGERLDGWWRPPPATERGVVLFLHGTPGTVPDQVWRLDQLKHSGLGILAIDWRGYGGSTGNPTELGLRADARAGFDFIRAAAPQSKIAVFGESLGTGPAVALARDRPVAGVLLNAPYASVRRLFELRGLPIPYRWLMKDPFDSEALIGGVTAPLLILHGTDDPAIPVGEAHRLYDAAHEPKMIFIADGAGHLDAWEGGGERLALEALARWTTPAELAR
ncbi:MAG: alpha/beta hydrolase, partial [Alphaproteobacteria bacterium]